MMKSNKRKNKGNQLLSIRKVFTVILAVICVCALCVSSVMAEEELTDEQIILDNVTNDISEETPVIETSEQETTMLEQNDLDDPTELSVTDLQEPGTGSEIPEEETDPVFQGEEPEEPGIVADNGEEQPDAAENAEISEETQEEKPVTNEEAVVVIEQIEAPAEEVVMQPEVPDDTEKQPAETDVKEPETDLQVTVELEETEEETLDTQEDRESLSYGMIGEDVLKMQTALKELNYLSVSPDGIFGNKSLMAVKKFQLYNGLAITGDADSQTLATLYGGNAAGYKTLWRGMSGTAVYNVQRYLYNAGFLPVAPDGIFGGYTEAAVKIYQIQAGLDSPDGGVGNWTTSQMVDNSITFQSSQMGDRGSMVMALQQKLKDLGYLSVTPDGIFGRYSERAIKKFQMYAGFEITGIADCATVNAIFRGTPAFYTLYKGSRGTPVLALQKLLAELGYLTVTPDGIYGNYSVQAVKSFQKANGISSDGAFGRISVEKMFNDPIGMSEALVNAAVDYGGTYLIRTSLGSTVLKVTDSSVYDGANVELYSNQEQGAEKWVMQNAGDGYYYIRNLRSWKVLDLVDGNVMQYRADGSSTQKWKIVKQDNGGFQVVNANGMYLDLSGSSALSGTNVTVSAGSSSQSQVWYFDEVDPGTALDFRTDGTQYLGIRTFNISSGNVTETSGYYNIQTEIDLPSGGYYLSGGDNYSIGLKVMYVNSYLASQGYLSWDYYNYNRYDGNTVWAVRQFQSDYGLSVDGVVGLATWRAMGYSDYEWYHLGDYTTELKVYAYGSSRDTYVNAMLSTAQEYAWAGTSYSDGASGIPGTYVDCSGLIYQCLYAAGINPDTNIIDHARVVYEYTSNYLGNDWQMGVAVSYAQPGDLIFYGGSSINHVAIYAGDGMIYDSWPGIGVTYRNMYSGGNILKIVRVF